MQHIKVSKHLAGVAFASIALLLMGIVGPLGLKTANAASSCQYFSQTGHSICGRFLQYWNANGGLAQQGYPISDEFTETNAPPPAGDGKSHTVQYFQRARFESHPENAVPNDVLLGLLGSEQFQTKYIIGGQKQEDVQHPMGTCQYFAATKLYACGVFLTYWQQHGGVAQYGYPVSDTILEQNAPPPAGDGQQHVVQYFQRARFELHGDDQTVNNVELGLLGSEQYQAKYVKGESTTAASTLDSEEQSFLSLINQYRKSKGLGQLTLNTNLINSSKWYSKDMASKNYFNGNHIDSLGRTAPVRLTAFGYSTATKAYGENIAAGNATASATLQQWENSLEHNQNMLNPNYTVIGIGRAYNSNSKYGWYWTTDFGIY